MKNLVVITNNAPIANIMAVLATWAKLAELIEQKVKLLPGCQLVWELHLQHVGYRGHVLEGILGISPEKAVDCWESYSTASVVYDAFTHYDTVAHRVEVPIIQVTEIMINDDGTFFWHGEMKEPEQNIEDVDKLALALTEGKLPSGHGFIANHFPVLEE